VGLWGYFKGDMKLGLPIKSRSRNRLKDPLKLWPSTCLSWIDPIGGVATFGVSPKVSRIVSKGIGSATYDWIQNTAGGQPDLTSVGGINGKRTIRFGGDVAGESMTGGGAMNADLTDRAFIIQVIRSGAEPQAAGDQGTDDYSGNSQQNYWRDVDKNVYCNIFSTTRHALGKVPTNFAKAHVREIYSIDGEYTVWVNGVQVYTTAANTFSNPLTTAVWGESNGKNFLGDFGETIILTSKPTDAERRDNRKSLNNRWKVGIAETRNPSFPLNGRLAIVSKAELIVVTDKQGADQGGTINRDDFVSGNPNIDGIAYDPTTDTFWVTAVAIINGEQIWNINRTTGAKISSIQPSDFGEGVISIENIAVMPDGTLLVLVDATSQGDVFHINRDGSLIAQHDLTAITLPWVNQIASPQDICVNPVLKQIIVCDNQRDSLFFFDYSFNFIRQFELTNLDIAIEPQGIDYDPVTGLYWINCYLPEEWNFLIDGNGKQHYKFAETEYGTENDTPTGIAVIS